MDRARGLANTFAKPWTAQHVDIEVLDSMYPGKPGRDLHKFKPVQIEIWRWKDDEGMRWLTDMDIDSRLFYESLNLELTHISNMVKRLRLNNDLKFAESVKYDDHWTQHFFHYCQRRPNLTFQDVKLYQVVRHGDRRFYQYHLDVFALHRFPDGMQGLPMADSLELNKWHDLEVIKRTSVDEDARAAKVQFGRGSGACL